MDDSAPWYDPPGHTGKRAQLRHEFPDIGGGKETSDPNWDDYAFGYQRAIEVLLASANTQEDLDILVYPIVWLSRHAVELALKGLIVAYREELGTTEWFEKHHRLPRVWSVVETLLRKLHPLKDLSALTLGIERLSQLDPGGTCFRYPENTDGDGNDRTPTTTEMAINLDVVADLAITTLNAIAYYRVRVEDEGEERRADAYHAAEEEWLSGLSGEERDEYITEQDDLLNRWLEG
jgi:hypothetical protein